MSHRTCCNCHCNLICDVKILGSGARRPPPAPQKDANGIRKKKNMGRPTKQTTYAANAMPNIILPTVFQIAMSLFIYLRLFPPAGTSSSMRILTIIFSLYPSSARFEYIRPLRRENMGII